MPEQTEKPKLRISTIMAMLMVFTALVFDGLQFLLTLFVITVPLAWLTSMFAVVLFWLWFLLLGVSYMSGRKSGLKIATALSSVIVELVPVVNALPGTTLGVLGVIVISRLEDSPAGKVVKNVPSKRM